MIGPPQWRRLGDAFEFRWDAHRITLAHFRESKDDLKAELTAERAEGEGWVPLSGLTVINLLAVRTRQETARHLANRDDSFPWADAIEAVTVISVREWRRGGPIVTLRDTECSDHVDYLVDRLLPVGETSILFGDGEAGKSMFSMFVAVSVATGCPLPHGIGPNEPGNVLYLDYESDVEEHARRLKKIAAGLNVDVPENVYYRESHRPIHEEAGLLAKEVAAREIALIVVDSLAPACGGDPSDPGLAISTMNALRSLGGTRLAIGHVNKTDRNQMGTNQTTFGSIFWRNMTRSMWQLQANSEGSIDGRAPFALHNRKNNNAARERFPLGMQYMFAPKSIGIETFYVSAGDVLAEGASLGTRILRALNHRSMNTTELADELGVDDGSIRQSIKRLNGAVIQVEGGTPGRNGRPAIWGVRAK